jgi:hypothetical protein
MMSCHVFVPIFVAVLPAAVSGQSHATDVVSTFDFDAERWQAEGGTLTHRSRDRAEGYIEITDTASQHSMAVIAPEQFAGNLLRFDGGMLGFDACEIAIPTRGPWSAFGKVTIISSRGEAHADLSPQEATNDWRTYSIRLVASNWHVEPTLWRQLLGNVKAIRVTLESCSVLGETVGFDNFRLSTRPDIIAEEEFYRCDVNEDNRLNADEFPSRLRHRWKQLDANGDGWVDRGEAKFDPY